MEIPDIHVRVLFDFEYTTKDGAEVKIKEGEKLYLIKKTNEDWWQVIRNSGRPFYVPASYIEEIPRSNTWSKADKHNDELNKSKSKIIDNYRMRSCSVESQQTHENHKTKPAIPKRTIFDTKRANSVREPIESSKFSRADDDAEDDEEADYVNIIKQNSERCVQPLTPSTDKDPLSTASNVDRLLENISNNLMSVDDEFRNGYSHVAVRTCSLSPMSYDEQLNLSNSLEELTQQIERKAKSIGAPTSNSEYSKKDKLVKSMSKDMLVSAKNPNHESSPTAPKQINESPKELDDSKNKLQYSGSFKTKHERDKWAKNYVYLSSMREEETSGDVTEDDSIGKRVNDNNNNLNTRQSNDDVSEGCGVQIDLGTNLTKSDSCDNVNSGDQSVGSDSKTSNEKIDAHVSVLSVNEPSENSRLKFSFDSSTEDLDKNSSYVNSRLTLSDKGSTDSLLDLDSHLSIQESICTTASDSLLHTSDTSEECLSSILREEPSLDEQHQRKKAALKRNNRVSWHSLTYM